MLTEITSIMFMTNSITISYKVEEKCFFINELKFLALILFYLDNHETKICLYNTFRNVFLIQIIDEIFFN